MNTARLGACLALAATMTALAGVSPARAHAQAVAGHPAPVIAARGNGPSVVLLSGLLGGVTRMQPLADTLVAKGFRVLVIDPYQLASTAPDVSFHGLAREVAAEIAREGMDSAVVVAHAHATGIAVRLAVSEPQRVQHLVLLDGGLLASTRSPGVTRALRLASFIAHLPGGKALIRSRIISGIRGNSGSTRWLTDSTAHQYADPLVAQLSAAVRMARRLDSAKEPEPVDSIVARLHTEVSILIGSAPHEYAHDADEVRVLEPLPTTRVRYLAGVGHFVHEEAIDEVVREVEAAHARHVPAGRGLATRAERPSGQSRRTRAP